VEEFLKAFLVFHDYDFPPTGASLPAGPVRQRDLGQAKQPETFISNKSMLTGQHFLFLWNEQ